MDKRSVYDFTALEQKWQAHWKRTRAFEVDNTSEKPAYYVLDMFPYPSGQGLHTGHALGYVASDIVTRYKKSLGYNVLHPMGFDAFGLPAEQYAQEVGQHPRVTTAANVKRYRAQLERLGIAFDWNREVCTSDPDYYRWTQWTFLKLFDSWYDRQEKRAKPISALLEILSRKGNGQLAAACNEETPTITAAQWHTMASEEQQRFLLHYRLAFLHESLVNWCPALGTVLANDEVKEGLSERGGHPVVKKKLKQWSLRTTAYADRLLEGLEEVDFPQALKEMQHNWIGRSQGANIRLKVVSDEPIEDIVTFTTCPETIYGLTYVVLAPEHPSIQQFIQRQQAGDQEAEQRAAHLLDYQTQAANLSERERMQKAEEVSGCFTGFYATHPLTHAQLPIWVGDYVLHSYGTGAVMGVPAHDKRDHAFATHFQLPITRVIEGKEEERWGKHAVGTMINSALLDGLSVAEARKRIIEEIEKRGVGRSNIQYRLRDAVFSRQRYWGEPFPIYYKGDVPYAMDEDKLPVRLPEIDDFKPTADGQPPLARAKGWHTAEGHPIEYNTMPGWAGSNWYFLRYMDPHNQKAFADKKAMEYWGAVDLYVGGAEHAVGHLLYARFLTMVLYDLGYLPFQEPFKKLVNQGMIQTTSHFVYRIKGTNQFVSYGKKDSHDTTPIRVPYTMVTKKVLDTEAFRQWREGFADATFILEDDAYICGQAIEKMSKSKHNSVNPDEVIQQYGADTLRLYIMFIGPLTQSKPWDTEGIEGVSRFLQKVWKLFHTQDRTHPSYTGDPSLGQEKIIHQAIKEVRNSIERYAFNTAVSHLMIAVNALLKESCVSKALLKDFLRLLAPLAPHIAEELWQHLGEKTSILAAGIPDYNPEKLISEQVTYPVAINGKRRAEITVPVDAPLQVIQQAAVQEKIIQKWLADKRVKKVIVIPKKMVNIVVG